MLTIDDFCKSARENEEVFRNILRDMRDNRKDRPNGFYIPEDLDTEGSLDWILKKYTKGKRTGVFTIFHFSRPQVTKAQIGFHDLAILSGGGAMLEYSVNADNTVEYKRAVYTKGS